MPNFYVSFYETPHKTQLYFKKSLIGISYQHGRNILCYLLSNRLSLCFLEFLDRSSIQQLMKSS